MKVALISCSKNKMDVECDAKKMYSKSSLFNKTINYCSNKNYDLILILSAKYGILKPSDVILPYELALNNLSKKEIKKWALRCYEILKDMKISDYEFDFYAGKNYFEELSKLLTNSNNILSGLGIGERLKFLNQ